jgi:hypothetical protein
MMSRNRYRLEKKNFKLENNGAPGMRQRDTGDETPGQRVHKTTGTREKQRECTVYRHREFLCNRTLIPMTISATRSHMVLRDEEEAVKPSNGAMCFVLELSSNLWRVWPFNILGPFMLL